MRPWSRRAKRIGVAAGALLFATILAAIGAAALYRAPPGWYAPQSMDRATMLASAADAEAKFTAAQNWAAKVNADAIRADLARQNGAAAPSSRAANSLTLSFTDVELNALFQKWAAVYGWPAAYAEFIDQPQIILQPGRVILAARANQLGTVASLHFAPALDADGKLHVDLVRILGGRLPLPEKLISTPAGKALSAVAHRESQWRARARITDAGAANESAAMVLYSRLFAHAMHHEPADAIVLLPLADGSKTLPARLADVRVDDGSIELHFQPLSPPDRADLLARLKSPESR